MDEERYRNELRSHFMRQVKNSKLQKYCTNASLEKSHTKDHTCRMQKFQQQHKMLQETTKYVPQPRSSGGDADCLLIDSVYASQESVQSFCPQSSEGSFTLRQLHPKMTSPKLDAISNTTTQKYCSDECNERSLYETDSHLGGIGDGSQDSAKTQKTSKTIRSRRSSHELRKMVKSKCKLHEEIDRTLKQINQSIEQNGITTPPVEAAPSTFEVREAPQCPLAEENTIQYCKQCTNRLKSHYVQTDGTTEMAKGDILENYNGNIFKITVDDVVNSKVINPMIRKLQRMYLNSLKDEMVLMEELEHLPHRVNEVYKASIFKQKD